MYLILSQFCNDKTILQAPDRASLDSAEVDQVKKVMKDQNLSRLPEPSDDEDDDRNERKDDKEEEEKKNISFFTYFKFLWAILNSSMVSMTRYLNRFSSDYRYIRKVLAKEKKILKVSCYWNLKFLRI